MGDNIINENENNFNIYNNVCKNEQIDDVKIKDIPGFFHNDIKNETDTDLNQEQNNYQYLFINEEIIPYSPEMSEEPINPNKTKKLIIDNIINKKGEQYHDDIFTFKNINKNGYNCNYNKTDGILETYKNDINLNNYNTINDKNKEINLDNNKIKASVLNFEDIITKENNELLNKSKSLLISKEYNNNQSNNSNNSNINNKKLNIQKKQSKKILNNKNTININNKIKKNKSQKKPKEKLNIFNNNYNTIDGVEFENFMKEKNIFIPPPSTTNRNKNKNNKRNMMKNENEKINNGFLKTKTMKQMENTEMTLKNKKLEKSNNLNVKKTKRLFNDKIRNKTSLINQNDISFDRIFNNKNNKKDRLNISNDKTLKKKKNNNNKSFSDIDNSILSSKSQIIKRKRANTLRNTKKIEETKVPSIVTELEFNSALKSEKIGKNIQKRFSNINNDIIKFDNSKFIKYDTDQILYGLIKDYSNIRPEKGDGFLQRMQFESLKRKNKDIKINELLEKSKKKYKMKETQREKAFDRLIDDANRRLILKQEMLENEKYLIDYKDLMNNEKKYNREEWNDIYKKRFKDYEECKKKKMDVQRQNEKIKKMLKEEEEINMCQMKKIPERRIIENTQRLYDDAKKRDIIRRQNMNSANNIINYKINKKKHICLTSFDDEDDASKYMKGFKSQAYSFIGDEGDNSSYIKKNNNNFNVLFYNRNQNCFDNNIYGNNNYSINVNKSFDKKMKDKNKISVTEFNNIRFDTRNNIQKKRINKKENSNQNQNNIEKKIFSTYFDYKKKKQNGLSSIQNNNTNNNTIPPIPYEYNYNNYNIYNFNNLNNNINNINNLNSNEENDNENDNYNLNNIANQFLQAAAMNKINKNNNKNNINNLYPDNKNNYFNANFNRNNNDNDNNILYNQYNNCLDNYKISDKKNDYDQNIETEQLVNQFLLNKYEY